MLRFNLEGISGFMAHDVLNLPRKGLIQRYSKILFCFIASGGMHLVADLGGGLSATGPSGASSGAMQFFCTQAIGIVLEDMVVNAFRYFVRTPSQTGSVMFSRVVGCMWVILFLSWSTPVWIYPIYRNMRYEDGQMSFEALKPIIFGRTMGTRT